MERKRLLFSASTDSTGSCARCLTASLTLPAVVISNTHGGDRSSRLGRDGFPTAVLPPQWPGSTPTTEGRKAGEKHRNTLTLFTWTLRWLDLDLPCGESNTLLSLRPPLLSFPLSSSSLSVKIPHRCCCCIRVVSTVFVSCADDFRQRTRALVVAGRETSRAPSLPLRCWTRWM